jgi:hypothetical protein
LSDHSPADESLLLGRCNALDQVMRPLFFDFWKDPGSETVDDEMMFGPDYLVAPQLIENATSRSVYLVRTTSDRFPFESSLYLSRACLDKPSLLRIA